MWGVISETGIVTAAKGGEQQARAWASYEYKGVGGAGERLARKVGNDWTVVE